MVLIDGGVTTAELAILKAELRPNETGAWLNSRGRTSGVIALHRDHDTKSGFRSMRVPLPGFVVAGLARIQRAANVAQGCPDLVIWRTDRESFRLIEVKCPRWDRPSREQRSFMRAALRRRVSATVVEWEFDGGAA